MKPNLGDDFRKLLRERALRSQQLIGHESGREDVGTRVNRLSGKLLGRDVVERAEQRTGLREAAVSESRDAEVENTYAPLGVDHHVRGLDVAMDDALGVRVVKSGQQLVQPSEFLSDGHRPPAGDDVGKRLSGDVLHDDERTVEERAGLEDGDDVRVTQRAGRPRLGAEPAAQVLFVEPLVQELDGDEAFDVRIASEVHTPHAAAAKPAQHVELVDPLDGWMDRHAGYFPTRCGGARLFSLQMYSINSPSAISWNACVTRHGFA